jgi:hypothetical protein
MCTKILNSLKKLFKSFFYLSDLTSEKSYIGGRYIDLKILKPLQLILI